MLHIRKIIGGAALMMAMGSAPLVAQTTQPEAMPQQSQEKIDVSDAELGKFADAFKQVQVISQQAQVQMAKTVEDEGLDVERFNEIHKASIDPNAETDTTPEELEKHKAIIAGLDTMQKDFEQNITKIIENQDISVERYQQVAMALQTDADLQQRLQKMLQG